MASYCVIGCRVLWREICHFGSFSRNVLDIRFLKQGLHQTPDLLRKELQAAVDYADQEDFDALLIGYGLCCNGIVGLTAQKSRLVLMRGHDCITFLLGSRERYQSYFDAHPGTYWYSPGWIDSGHIPSPEEHEKKIHEYREQFGAENAQYLIQAEHEWHHKYSNAAYVDLGFGNTEVYKTRTRKCAHWLNLEYDELAGDPTLIIRWLDGQWDTGDFLVVEPGQAVAASHDGSIIRST